MSQRILLLADVTSSHTEKWALAFANKGYTVGLFSLSKTDTNWYANNTNIFLLNEAEDFSDYSLFKNKLKYIFSLPKLLRAIRVFKPDIVHAHYATSYGLLGALSGFTPFIISAWGSDVFDFPKRSFLHRSILKFNLNRADKLLSTSHVMKKELSRYTSKDIKVIPFGVDTEVFHPQKVKKAKENNTLYIGTIKAIEEKYGIETIINAAASVKLSFPNIDFKVLLIGSGNNTSYYKDLVDCLSLKDNIIFTGKIPFSKIAYYHNLLDIFLNVSIVNESFGVSVIEAMACEKPVIVSNVGGLKEIVNSDTGILIEKGNVNQLAEAIKILIKNPETRTKLGKNARSHVMENYDFDNCLLQMIAVYNAATNKTEEYFQEKLKLLLNPQQD